MPPRSKILINFSFDANADTPIHPEVLETWVKAEKETPGNPASLHREGRRAQGVLENARDRVGEALGCQARDIIFTSGATEANNLAILGAARALARESGQPITLIASEAEHPAVLGPLRLLQQDGFPLRLLPLTPEAAICKADLVSALAEKSRPTLLALQWANNETGAIQPCPDLEDSLHWHCDGVQGLGKLPLDEKILSADALVFSGHKIRGPKGVGVLKINSAAIFDPVFGGGGQQGGLRPGTESPALAVAFAHALELAIRDQQGFVLNTSNCREAFLRGLGKDIAEYSVHHPLENGLTNTLSLGFDGIDGRMLLPACDAEGLRVSAGSACSSGAPEPSSVLRAAGLSKEAARSSLRISFGWETTPQEAERGGTTLATTLRRLYEVAIP